MPWNLLLLIPNLSPPIPTPYEAEGVCLCAADDDRMAALEANAANDMATRMVERFTTSSGEQYRPGCLIVRTDARAAVLNVESLRAFRNVCAVATTTQGCAKLIAYPFGAQWTARWSDHFVFGYHTPGRNGGVVTLDGAARGLDDEPPHCQSSPQIGRPEFFRLAVDSPLLERLFVAWRRYYVRRAQRTTLRRLFRSLEIAFHAGLFPGDGLTSPSDVGTRLALWVSAFEVLCHPGPRNVNKRDVQAVLRGAPFGLREMTAPRYRVRDGKKQVPATLPEALYDDLYAARNRFLHGSPFRTRDLHYRRSTRYLRLAALAPVLYNVALIAFLRSLVPGGPELPDGPRADAAAYWRRRAGFSDVQTALNAARYQLDKHGHPQVPVHRHAARTVVTPPIEE